MREPLTDSLPDDAVLAAEVAAAPAGTARAAEAELYRRLAPRVRLYGLRHLRNEQAAADLMQQVMLMALERLRAGKLREPARLASFVLGICRMVVLEHKRGQIRRERLLERYANDLRIGAPAESPRLDEQRLLACLQRLPERERTVLVLSFFDDRSADEVGRELAVSAGNVRVIRHRSIERLRKCMNSVEASV